MDTVNYYSKYDFIKLIENIVTDSDSERYQGELLEKLIILSEHPDGSDLIYYPEQGEDATPEAIVEKIHQWRLTNGKPSFKNS